MKYILTRDLTNQEKVVADENLKKGDTVFEYQNHTYGCITPSGMACTLEDGVNPFFEVPMDAIEKVIDKTSTEYLCQKVESLKDPEALITLRTLIDVAYEQSKKAKALELPKHETVEQLKDAYESIIRQSNIIVGEYSYCTECNTEEPEEKHEDSCIVAVAGKWLIDHGKPEDK